MKVNVHPPIGEVLRLWLAEHINNSQPRLCAEFEGADNDLLFKTLLEEVSSWTTPFVVLFASPDDINTSLIIEKSDLEELLVSYFLLGATVTIVNPANGDGCTVDWEGFNDNAIDSEVLVVTWGEYELIAQNLVDKLRVGSVFRGN